MEDKYIELLLKRCLRVTKNVPLFINYDKVCQDFVDKIVAYAEKMGLKDIYLDRVDSYKVYDVLKNSTPKEIANNKLFDASIWDVYAKKKAAFLMLESEIPNLMSDIPAAKMEVASKTRRESKPYYRDNQLKGEIPWCIACVPNDFWAKELFPKSDNPMEEFWSVIKDICMLDNENPIKAWDEFLNKQAQRQDKLNSLHITKLHYQNKLGTNLEVSIPEDALWCGSSTGKYIVNMPSYEVFTSPLYNKTNGIVYSSKELIYNGQEIKDFYLKFKDGKVIDYDAKIGKDVLKEIITSDKNACYLGEVALVDYNSPISKTNLVFKSTLLDENAACHLALGSSFNECLKDGNNYTQEELQEKGLNQSTNHVDFMIGTKDLMVEAETNEGIITIMKDGNLVI